jgi:hypothetical protein
MLFTEKIAACSENHTEFINILLAHNAVILNVEARSVHSKG